jgi:CRP/FNR family transcriptional regulator, cyclic AMP receptor protein
MPVTVDYFKNTKELKAFAPGDVLFKAGDRDPLMYAVRDGEVDIYFNNTLFETVGAGGFVGEKSLIDELPHTTTAIARTAVSVAVVDEQKFLFLVHETPTFALQVMRIMAQRQRNAMKIAIGAGG